MNCNITFKCDIKVVTDEACLVDTGDIDFFWLPLSVIYEDITIDDAGTTMEITIPERIAFEKEMI